MATGDKKRAVMTTDIDNSGSSYPVLGPTGDGSDVTAAFTAAASRTNISTGEKLSVICGKIAKWFTDLGAAAFRAVDATPTAGSTNLVESGGVKSALDATQTTTTGTLELASGVTATEASYVLCGKVMSVAIRGLAAEGSSWTRIANLPGNLTIPSGAREQSVLYDLNGSPYTIMPIRVVTNHIDVYVPVATGSYYGGITFILN